jgi:hypothetical protein
MTNEIQKVREDLEKSLESARLCPEERFTTLSPCGRYQLEVNGYATADSLEDATIAIAVIRNTATGEVIATVNRNDTRCFYAWITRDGHDYLLFPEDLEGQTVIDLTARRVEGFSSPDEPFIWTEFYPSDDKTKLAIVGCYWACPYQVTVYDFRDPLCLPLPILAQFDLPGNDANFGQWLSEATFSVTTQEEVARVFDLPRRSYQR